MTVILEHVSLMLSHPVVPDGFCGSSTRQKPIRDPSLTLRLRRNGSRLALPRAIARGSLGRDDNSE
jgi:hypothetical protein